MEPLHPGSSVQFSSVTQSCPTLCDPMNCSTPGLPVRHQLPEFTQTHVHRVSDAIQPSHPLSSPSPPAPIPPSIRVFSNESTLVERSDRMWSTGEGNGKSLHYSCLENPMNSMKRQNDRILKEELPRSVDAQYAAGDEWRNNSRKNEGMEPKQNKTQLWM